MLGRFSFKGSYNDHIAIECWDNANDLSVERHAHEFWELIFIKSGLAEHTYHSSKSVLMANDAILIKPHSFHSFEFSEEVLIYNVQFYNTALDDKLPEVVDSLSYTHLSESALEYAGIRPSAAASAQSPGSFVSSDSAPLNMTGIIHLSYSQAAHMEELLQSILEEKSKQLIRYQQVSRSYLALLLIYLERIMRDQFARDDSVPQKHKDVITKVLAYMDEHYTETIDFDLIAIQQNLSPNYFRKIFKHHTGTSPITHLNRIRVLKAIDFMRSTDASIGDIAASVGIFDANYFSRMFKKYTGYSPRYFINHHFQSR